MTWHFSPFGDYIAPGDAFPFQERHHNSNLWEMGSVLFTSKQEESSLNCYLISIKRLYHCNTIQNCLYFILQPSLVYIWISVASACHLGQHLLSLKLQTVLYITLSPWKNVLWAVGGDLWCHPPSKCWEDLQIEGRLVECQRKPYLCSGWGKGPSSQSSSYWSVEGWWWTQVTPSRTCS